MNNESVYHLITVILAIGAVIGPMFFGFLVFRLSQVFVTKTEHGEYKERADRDRDEMKETLRDIQRAQSKIQDKVEELLQRTAGERVKGL